MNDVKEKVIQKVMEMLASGVPVESITVREITSKLNISVSTINYHFNSKENLINLVIQRFVDKIISAVPEKLNEMGSLPPKEKLKGIVILTGDYLVKFPEVSRISILTDLTKGSKNDNTFSTINAFAPIVKEIVGEEKSTLYGMILAFSIQGLFLRTDVLKKEGITDFTNKEIRDKLIDNIIMEVLP